MDELIDAEAIARFRGILRGASGRPFGALERAADEVDGLKLRSRVDLVADALLVDLPPTYADAAVVVRAALRDPAFEGWTIWPVGEAMTSLALAADDGAALDGAARGSAAFDDGLALMADLTPRFSSEFAIRRFLSTDLDRALGIIAGWTSHADPHVRRLASEGTRAYLPWAIRVKEIVDRPDCTISVLDDLVRDTDEVVRRSVANHLNDLSRHAPELVVRTAARWMADPTPNTARLVRHGLRTLIKRGDPAALALQGFAPVEISVGGLRVEPARVVLPGAATLTFDLTNDADTDANVAVDYVIHFRKKNGSLASKVFKLATRTLAAGETATFAKRHALHQMTTRVHYSGVHEVELQINGARHGHATFDVVAE